MDNHERDNEEVNPIDSIKSSIKKWEELTERITVDSHKVPEEKDVEEINLIDSIRSSLKKWERIEESLKLWETNDLKAPPIINWVSEYWHSCGYCEYYDQCSRCYLCEKSVDGIPICLDSCNVEVGKSWALDTLLIANIGEFNDAIEKCEVVIVVMRDHLKKEEEKNEVGTGISV